MKNFGRRQEERVRWQWSYNYRRHVILVSLYEQYPKTACGGLDADVRTPENFLQ